MSSDRAKISYDEKQQYRSVIMQQGRVTLEADWNEQGQIVAEEIRQEALDFVGPSGTPDDGYAVSKVGSGVFDLSVSPGTLYVGGLRVSLGQALSDDRPGEFRDMESQTVKQAWSYSNQPEWLDHAGDLDWVPVPDGKPDANEYVYLLLREQEVSAVEDSALREVALGGPDTAARTRLIQRIVRSQTKQADCPLALAELVEGHWKQQGLTFDPATMRLASQATLALRIDTPATEPDPCQPQSSGGYLCAENQLIRVKVSAFDPVKKEYKLVWGFDNAAFLYLVEAVNSDKELKLNTGPVDSAHRPVKGQAVEVLRAAAKLANGKYVAADHGFVTALSANYNADAQTIELSGGLKDYPQISEEYLSSPQLYVRVWQEEVPLVSDTDIKLGGTGLIVTLAPDKNGLFHVGDYWTFAVRPGTPTQVYPQRYLSKLPQLQDGPRLWACPLALVDWQVEPGVMDCRNHFDNLVKLTRRHCCVELVATPGPGWEKVFDAIPDWGDATICFPPGHYPLQQTLTIARRGRLRLMGAGAASRLVCPFAEVVLLFQHCASVDLRDLHVHGHCDSVDPRDRKKHGTLLPQEGLGGALSFYNVSQVTLASVTVRCKGRRSRQLCCVRVENKLNTRLALNGRVSISQCEFYVGHLQIGVLVLNVRRTHIQDNRFVPSGPNAEPVKKALRDKQFQDNLAQSALVILKIPSDPEEAQAYIQEAKDKNQLLEITIRDSKLYFRTDEGFLSFWEEFIKVNRKVIDSLGSVKPKEGGKSDKNMHLLRVFMTRHLKRLLGSHRRRNDSFKELFQLIDNGSRAVIGQAIVIGGQYAEQVIIENNDIKDAVQGIHVGLSHATKDRSAKGADSAVRVIVRQNSVNCVLCVGAPLERHGIFVGNASSIAIMDNYLTLERLAGVRHLAADGVRIYGFLGEFVQVRSNHFKDFTHPITVCDLGDSLETDSRVYADNFPSDDVNKPSR